MFFNNCINRDHQRIFGPGAFYDLETSGRQATLAQDMRPGDTCIVVAYEDKARTVVRFTWYQFTHETRQPDEKGMLARVLWGQPYQSEALSKRQAAEDTRFHILFNKLGHFKQVSVMARAGSAQ